MKKQTVTGVFVRCVENNVLSAGIRLCSIMHAVSEIPTLQYPNKLTDIAGIADAAVVDAAVVDAAVADSVVVDAIVSLLLLRLQR